MLDETTLLYCCRFLHQKNRPASKPSTTTGTTTPIAALAPVDKPPDESLEFEPPVFFAPPGFVPVVAALVVVVVVIVVDCVSVLWYTILIPKAFKPPGAVKVPWTVLVMPLLLTVMGSVVPSPSGAIHVQNKVDQTLSSVLAVTQESDISVANVGQHVTVVIRDAPILSWQAE